MSIQPAPFDTTGMDAATLALIQGMNDLVVDQTYNADPQFVNGGFICTGYAPLDQSAGFVTVHTTNAKTSAFATAALGKSAESKATTDTKKADTKRDERLYMKMGSSAAHSIVVDRSVQSPALEAISLAVINMQGSQMTRVVPFSFQEAQAVHQRMEIFSKNPSLQTAQPFLRYIGELVDKRPEEDTTAFQQAVLATNLSVMRYPEKTIRAMRIELRKVNKTSCPELSETACAFAASVSHFHYLEFHELATKSNDLNTLYNTIVNTITPDAYEDAIDYGCMLMLTALPIRMAEKLGKQHTETSLCFPQEYAQIAAHFKALPQHIKTRLIQILKDSADVDGKKIQKMHAAFVKCYTYGPEERARFTASGNKPWIPKKHIPSCDVFCIHALEILKEFDRMNE